MNESKNNSARHEKATKKDNNKNQTITQTKTHTITSTNSDLANKSEQSNKQANENYNNKNQKANNQKNNYKGTATTKNRNCIAGLIIIGSTIIVGVIATLLGSNLDDSVMKPPAYAPDWVFPVAWSILYIAIGVAAYLAYVHEPDKKKRKNDLICYGVHLFFNLMWPLFYFTLDLLIFSSIWLVAVVITAIIVTYKYYKTHLAPGIIFTIYTIWLLYALYLNLGIAMLNT